MMASSRRQRRRVMIGICWRRAAGIALLIESGASGNRRARVRPGAYSLAGVIKRLVGESADAIPTLFTSRSAQPNAHALRMLREC